MKMTPQEVYALQLATAQIVAPRWGLNPEALAQWATAITGIESTYNTTAKAPSPHTAKGLMQINNITKTEAERQAKLTTAPMEKMFEPEYNVLLGQHMLGYRLKQCKGNVDHGIAAYNQGNCGVAARLRAAAYLRKWKKFMRDLEPVFGTRVAVVPALQTWY